MKRKWISVIVCAVMIVSLTAAVYAAGAVGSEDDPVVTKSYVDAKIAELQNGSQGSGGETDVFHAVNIPAGKKLIGGEGTELILRSGSATALDNGADGVSDLTGGTDLRTGTAVAKNHLLLVPRADGRGIYAATEIWVMIKGAYTLE